VLARNPSAPKIGQKKSPGFPNPWLAECSEGALRRAWKRLGLCRALKATP
jgi:hypothetical protein